jgi:hypothetical protein
MAGVLYARAMPAAERSWFRLAVLLLALSLGCWLRLRDLATLPLHGDEYHTLLRGPEHLDLGEVSYGELFRTFDEVGSHVPLPILQRLSLDLFGSGVTSLRLVAIVPGLALLLLAYPMLCAFVSADAAALGTLALALNPLAVYYSRFARGYALGLLLAFVLGWAVRRVLTSEGRTRGTWAALIASGALLPWVHLSTAGFVLAVALTGILLAARASRAAAVRLLLVFACAAGIALLLYLPTFSQVLAYFREMKPEDPPLDWLGVPSLIAGSRPAACAWLALLPIGGALSWRARSAAVCLALAALAGPLALLLWTQPRGMDYAWARYIASALPFLVAFVATGLVELVRRARLGNNPALACGAVLLLAQHVTGPIGPSAPKDGSFSNTYLALHALPAFDEPFPETSQFYRLLASDPAIQRIVEVPPIYTRAALLLRNYALQHGKEVLIGWPGEIPRGIRAEPYVRPLELTPDQAGYVVLHKDPASEVTAYFRYVYEDLWPRTRAAADDTFMRRQETIYGQNLLNAEQVAPVAARLAAAYGPATYKDEFLLVWKLAR